MEKIYILKPGKNQYGKNQTPVSEDDFIVINQVKSTKDILNEGSTGEFLYLESNAVVPTVAEATDVITEWVDGTLDFWITATNFPVDKIWYSALPRTKVTLSPSDPTLGQDRIDLLVAYTNGTVGRIEGVTSANPSQPSYDASTTYPIRFILVKGQATVPDGFTETDGLIFDENVGEPTEWTFSSTSGTIVANATEPDTGSIGIETTFPGDALADFENDVLINSEGINILRARIKLKKSAKPSSNGYFYFYDKQGSTYNYKHHFAFKNGDNGFQSWNVVDWQTLRFDLSDVNLAPFDFNCIRFRFLENNYEGLFLDNISLQYGTTNIEIPDTITKTKLSQFINDGNGDISMPFVTVAASGLEAVDDGNGIGWRLIGTDTTYHANNNEKTVDFSHRYAATGTTLGTSAYQAVAFGDDVISSGQQSFIIGDTSEATGYLSVVMGGYLTTATNTYSMAFGGGNTSNGFADIVFGGDNLANSFNAAFVTGRGSQSTSAMGMTAGIGLRNTNSFGASVFGTANVNTSGSGASFSGTDSLFVVGNGTFTTPAGSGWTAIVESNAFHITRAGTITAPSMTTDMIDSADSKVLVTKEWVTVAGSTGLEAVDEGNGVGYRLVGKDPAHYANIGLMSVDFSDNSLNPATGDYGPASGQSFNFGTGNKFPLVAPLGNYGAHFAYGGDNIVDGYYNSMAFGTSNVINDGYSSMVIGYGNEANLVPQVGQGFAAGTYNQISHYWSFALGTRLLSKSRGTVAVGIGNTDYAEIGDAANRPAFVVGNGNASPTEGAGYGDIISRSDALTVRFDGSVTAPSLTPALITSYGDPSLITKEYGDANYLGAAATGLETLNEGNGIGWRLAGRVAANYGNIGVEATDLSYSSGASSVRGATGGYSFATGFGTEASGQAAVALGVNTTASGTNSFAVGSGSDATGPYSFAGGLTALATEQMAFAYGQTITSSGLGSVAMGDDLFSRSRGEAVFGMANTDYTPTSITQWSALDRLFVVGNGLNAGAPSDAFMILKNGTITAPSLTPALIDTAGNSALITKEYGDANYLGGANPTLTTKGQLLTYSTTPSLLGTNGDGKILSTNSATSTGLEWITPASSGIPYTGASSDVDLNNRQLNNVYSFNGAFLDAVGGTRAICIGSSTNSMTNQTGTNVVGIGYNPLTTNAGSEVVGIGTAAGVKNRGSNVIFIGEYAGEQNIGNFNIGFGESSLEYQTGTSNTALGDKSFRGVLNVAGAKTVTGVNVGADQMTATAHGFGANGAWVTIDLDSTGATPAGAQGTNFVQIVDANTLQFAFLMDAGSGTITLTPYYSYSNSTAVGANSVVTKSNQVVIGDASVSEVVMGDGTVIFPAPEGSGVPYTGATADVDLGSHTIALGKEVITTTKNKYQATILNGTDAIIKQITERWTGFSWQATTGYAFGVDALLNNTGQNSNGIGFEALKGNTGDVCNGIGYQSLFNNSGIFAFGGGTAALYNNTGDYATGIGYQSLYNNTGANCNGIGYQTLFSNDANDSNAFGHQALYNNSGINSNGFGTKALYENNQNEASGFGHSALERNSGANSSGFGVNALRENTATSSSGFGHSSLETNTGLESSGVGHNSLQYNAGHYTVGVGKDALRYNQEIHNTAIGYKAYDTFLSDTANNKTFNNTDINVALSRVTITAHGFGLTGARINLQYTEGTAAISGLVNNVIYKVKIIDANTLEFYGTQNSLFYGANITNAGSGTGHTLTPQFSYSNTTSIGANSQPTKSNQVVLGDANVTEVVMGNGDVIYPAAPLALQKEITAATYTVTDADSGYIIWLNNAGGVVVTIDTLTVDSFECEFINEGASNSSFASGTATINTAVGGLLATHKKAKLIRKMSTTTYTLVGELHSI